MVHINVTGLPKFTTLYKIARQYESTTRWEALCFAIRITIERR